MWMRLVGTLQSARCHLHSRGAMLSNPQVKLCWLDSFVCLACFCKIRVCWQDWKAETGSFSKILIEVMTCCLQMCKSQVGSKELQGLHAETIEKQASRAWGASCYCNGPGRCDLVECGDVHEVNVHDASHIWTVGQRPKLSPFVFYMVWCSKPTEHE